jgi:pyrroline-5-carboxylate reductase
MQTTSLPSTLPGTLRIALIGGGNMARGLIGGLLGRGASPALITVSDPLAAGRAALERDFAIRTTEDNAAAARGADVVVLAVKPQQMSAVARALAPALAHSPLVVSVAAGIRASDLQRWVGAGVPVVRAMPNRPALIGAGASGLYAGASVGPAQRALAQQVLGASGLCVWVDAESDLDLVTALSGSGPAYFFRLAELMSEAAIAQGLEPLTARKLAAQTLAGAGQLVAAELAGEAGADLARMRAEVTSKGGTTEAALAEFDARGLGATVAAAQAAAARRSQELAEQFGVAG